MKNKGWQDQIDLKALVYHSGAFGAYLVGYLIFMIELILNELNLVSPVETYIFSIVSITLSFVSQLFLAAIFLLLTKPDPNITNATTEIVVQDFDEEAEIQAYIWMQFLRRNDESTRSSVLLQSKLKQAYTGSRPRTASAPSINTMPALNYSTE